MVGAMLFVAIIFLILCWIFSEPPKDRKHKKK